MSKTLNSSTKNNNNALTKVVWVNKGRWMKPGPIVYMGLLNALGFAWNQWDTDYFVTHNEKDSDSHTDMYDYYGIEPTQYLTIHRITNTKRNPRQIYTSALRQIARYCSQGFKTIVLTRELGLLHQLIYLKYRFSNLIVVHEAHNFYMSTKHVNQRTISDYRRQIGERILIPNLDGLVCITEHQRALYQHYCPKLKIIAQPLGCLSHQQEPIESRFQKRQIAYIGHLHDSKGMNLVIELAKALKEKKVRIMCFGGNEPEVAFWQRKAVALGLKSILSFQPFISPKELHKLLRSEISIGLVPLQDTFYNRYLTCPVKLLDFISHGIPVVGSELPCVRDIGRNAVHYCPPHDEQAFAKSIERLLDSSFEYKKASSNSLERAQGISWEERASSILNAFT